MHTMPQNSSPSNASPDKNATECRSIAPWRLVCIPIGIGLLLSLAVVFIQWTQRDEAKQFFIGLDGMRLPIALMLAMVAIVFAIFYSYPRSRRTIFLGAMLLTALGCVSSYLLKVDSYYGNRVPKLGWRWKPTAEQSAERYFISRREDQRIESLPLVRDLPYSFPGFLGKDRNATVPAPGFAKDWEANPPQLLWRHPVGLGWGSFAVASNRAITMEQRGTEECVVCYETTSGREIWSLGYQCRFRNEYGDGPRSTPTISGQSVVSVGATGIVTCIDIQSGKLRWKKQLDDPAAHGLTFGLTCSPVVHDGRVFLTQGSSDGGSAICLSLSTGVEYWRNGNDHGSYASPMLAQLCDTLQYVSFNGEGLRSYDLDGNPLWFFPWQTQGESRVNVAQPILVPMESEHKQTSISGLVLISSGYDRGTALIEVSKGTHNWNATAVWTSNHLKSKLSNFVCQGDAVFGLDNGLLTCISLVDGRRLWKKGRCGHGQMLLVGSTLLIQAEQGDIVLVAAESEAYREITRFKALDDKTWNHPTLAGRLLIVRNDREAAAYELPID